MKQLFILLAMLLVFSSCEFDKYETSFNKTGKFTIARVKSGGKTSSRYFTVMASNGENKVRCYDAGSFREGESLTLAYDSVTNLTRKTYELEFHRVD